MAIKRWNANTSQWELVGTPGTATPSAIGAASLANANTFLSGQVLTSNIEWPLISTSSLGTSSNRNHILLQRSNAGAAIPSGFTLGGIGMGGYDGSNYSYGWNGGAEITAYAAQNFTPTNRGTDLAFFTTANNTNSIQERMRITASGNIGIGTSNPTSKLHLYVSSGDGITLWDGTYSHQIDQRGNTLDIRADQGNTGGDIRIFNNGNTERMRINSNGNIGVGWSGDANWGFGINNSTAGAGAFLSTTSANILSGLFEATNNSYTNTVLKVQTYRSNSTAFNYFTASSSITGTLDTDYSIRGDGQVFTDGSTSMSTPADYAEYFEWADGNPNNEDRVGYSVSLINGTQIKISEEGEESIGIVSGNPAVVGDAAWNNWIGKYKKDEFNRYIRDENGDRILSEDYNSEEEYVSRENRPEWSPVGMVGKLRMRKGQLTNSRWIKMRDISAEVEEWLVR